MPEINKIMKDVATAVARNKGATGEVLDNLNKAAINVGKAAKSMQNLADYLEQHPEALIKGKK
jgi:glutamyl-tRNA reductase